MKTTLREALEAWQKGLPPGDHPTLDELYAAAARGRLDAAIVEHVAKCGHCARELGALADGIDEALGIDLVLPKAAAAPLDSPVSLVTECGKYTVGVYPRSGRTAMVTVEVQPALAAELEGRMVTLTDRGGTVLLSAPLVLGRASGRIAEVDTLDLTRLVVRALPPRTGEPQT